MAEAMIVTAAAAASSSFSVVFSDGDREVEFGPVAIYSALVFAELQSIITEKIGLIPHQISVSLVRRNEARTLPDVRRKVTIDEGTDLYALVKEKDCITLAMLRPSRRDQRPPCRRGRESLAASALGITILKRIAPVTAVDRPVTAVTLSYYETQVIELQRQREMYLMTTALAYGGSGSYCRLKPAEKQQQQALPVCEQCASGMSDFHLCVRDAITVGFRSSAGPIQRPSKLHLEASA